MANPVRGLVSKQKKKVDSTYRMMPEIFSDLHVHMCTHSPHMNKTIFAVLWIEFKCARQALHYIPSPLIIYLFIIQVLGVLPRLASNF